MGDDQYCTVVHGSDEHDVPIAATSRAQVDDFGRLRQCLFFGGMMQGYQSTPSQRLLNAAKRPHCPHCKSRMLLVGIESGSRGYDYQTFECAKCDHANTGAVSKDRRIPSALALVRGKLRSPK